MSTTAIYHAGQARVTGARRHGRQEPGDTGRTALLAQWVLYMRAIGSVAVGALR